jgi:sugar lactone lactonase YvrE
MKTPLLILVLAAGTSAFSASGPMLVKLWETEATLKVPESVLHDAKRDVLYVTNIDGEPWGDDGKGSVGKVSLEGKVINPEWVTGLSAPKGMALHHNRLYIGDVGHVVVVDVDRGAIVERIAVEGANGLNDVAVDARGVLYVSDSRAKKLYRIEQGKATLLLEGLKGPNGVHVRGDEVLFMDNGSLYRLGKDNGKVLLSAGMEGNGDGLESDDRGGFVISYWPGVIHYARADGSRVTLLDTSADKIYAADIGYHASKRIVYVPTFFGNTVVAYELK